MTKEEIYVSLGYTGKYTKDVKKRLRDLIKKYHPDVYSGGDEIIKLLYQVKDEIENDRVDHFFYQKDSPIDNGEPKAPDDKGDFYFAGITMERLEKKISELKKVQKQLRQELQKIDHAIHEKYQIFQRVMEKYEESKVKIDVLQKSKPHYFTMISNSFLVFFSIFVLISIVSSSVLFFSFAILVFFFFLFYLYSLKKKIMGINQEISRTYANKNTYYNEALDIKLKISSEEKGRFQEYERYRDKANDIQLYYYELSKKQTGTMDSKQRDHTFYR